MTWLRVMLVVYGLINIAGGVIGYMAAGSTMSLVTGSGAGLIILALTYLAGSKPAMAYRTLGIVVLALEAFWVYRLVTLMNAGEKIMMAAGNVGLATIMLGALAYGHFSKVRAKQ